MPCSEVRRHCSEQYLRHVRGLGLRIEALRDEVERQRALLGPCSQQVGERVSGTRSTGRFEEGVVRLHELIEAYCTELAGYVDEYHQAHEAIRALGDGTHAAVLTAHYLQGRPWREVARAMAYSEGGVLNIRKAAVDALYDHIPAEWRRLPEAL